MITLKVQPSAAFAAKKLTYAKFIIYQEPENGSLVLAPGTKSHHIEIFAEVAEELNQGYEMCYDEEQPFRVEHVFSGGLIDINDGTLRISSASDRFGGTPKAILSQFIPLLVKYFSVQKVEIVDSATIIHDDEGVSKWKKIII